MTFPKGVIMKKLNIALKINDYKINTTGYINKDIISFKDYKKENTEMIYDLNKDILIRDNKEITIKMYFNKETDNIEYTLKEHDKKFFQNLEKIKLLKDETNIIISYRIEESLFNLYLHYEEVK